MKLKTNRSISRQHPDMTGFIVSEFWLWRWSIVIKRWVSMPTQLIFLSVIPFPVIINGSGHRWTDLWIVCNTFLLPTTLIQFDHFLSFTETESSAFHWKMSSIYGLKPCLACSRKYPEHEMSNYLNDTKIRTKFHEFLQIDVSAIHSFPYAFIGFEFLFSFIIVLCTFIRSLIVTYLYIEFALIASIVNVRWSVYIRGIVS